jgi:hypothetical protein
MKTNLLILFIVILLCLTGPSNAKQFGVGFMIGEPTVVLCGKLWLNQTNAIDGGFSWSLKRDYLWLFADYLWHNSTLIPVTVGQMPIYFGPGGVIGIGDRAGIGVRGNFGIAYIFGNAPLDIFLEFAPTVSLVPEPDFGVTGGLGLRFFFGK